MSKVYRCDLCGRFRKDEELIGAEGDSSDGYEGETWLECAYCCSDFDYEKHFEKDLGKRK